MLKKGLIKIVYFDDGSNRGKQKSYRRKRNNPFLTLLIGFVLGAFLFALALPKLIELELLPYEFYLISEDSLITGQNLTTNPNQQPQMMDSITPISVNIATQVTDIVERVTPAVVGVEGIGFAIPMNEALPIIKELESTGQMTRAFLGVEAYSLIDVPKTEWQQSLLLPAEVTGGIYIQSVEPFTPADYAGLQAYDVIVELDGQPVHTIVDLRKFLYQQKSPGDQLLIQFYRLGEVDQVIVELTKQ